MITEEEIKNVFRECGFHVTPTNMHSRVDEFDPHTGDLVKDQYVVGSEWYNIKSGDEIPEDYNVRFGNAFPITASCISFSDLSDLMTKVKEADPMKTFWGDVFSYLIHTFNTKDNLYYLWGASHTSDIHSWMGELFWMNREKIKRDKEKRDYNNKQLEHW